jgi:hypothetical protein
LMSCSWSMAGLVPRLHAACVVFVVATAIGCGSTVVPLVMPSPTPPQAPSAPPSPPPSGSASWSLVFADEFDTAGALDPAKWGYEIGDIRNDEKQYYTSRLENVRAEGGNLVIEARKES